MIWPVAPSGASTSATTCRASSSQFEPGKRTTPNRMLRDGSFHPEVLDDGVGQEVPAHVLDARGGGALGHLELDVLADAHAGDLVEAGARQRPLHRLALRVEDALLQ